MNTNTSLLSVDGVPLEQLITDLFGQTLGIRSAAPLPGGQYNLTFGLLLNDDRRVVLRAAPADSDQLESERYLMRNEVAAAPIINELAAIPRILAIDFSHRLVRRDLVVQSWLSGVPASDALRDGGDAAGVALWRQLGEILARIHARRGDRFGRFVGPQADGWTELLMIIFDDLGRDFAAARLDTSPIRACVETLHHRHETFDTVQPRLLHGDLGPGNVMVRSGTDPTITGLVDTDRTWWGDPSADWTFYLLAQRRPEQQRAFWEGYGGADLGRQPEIRALVYRARCEAEASLELHRLGRFEELKSSQRALDQVGQRMLELDAWS